MQPASRAGNAAAGKLAGALMQSGLSQRRLHWYRCMLGRACGQAQQRGWQSLNPRHPLTTSGLEPEQQLKFKLEVEIGLQLKPKLNVKLDLEPELGV